MDRAGGQLYVSSTQTNEVLRYDGTTGASVGVFVTAGSGGLLLPNHLVLGTGGELYVSSVGGDAVLRYDGMTGAFLGEFVTAASGGLDGPTGIVFVDLPSPPTTTTTTLPRSGCGVEPVAPTFRSLNCRLAALIEQTGGEPALGDLTEKLLGALNKARDRNELAESGCAQGQTRKARVRLKQAIRQLAKYSQRLRSHAARKVPDEVRQLLGLAADTIRRDARTLRSTLGCPEDAGT